MRHVKRIALYTLLTYVGIIAVILADSNYGFKVFGGEIAFTLFFALFYLWWLVPILVAVSYIVIDWLRMGGPNAPSL